MKCPKYQQNLAKESKGQKVTFTLVLFRNTAHSSPENPVLAATSRHPAHELGVLNIYAFLFLFASTEFLTSAYSRVPPIAIAEPSFDWLDIGLLK